MTTRRHDGFDMVLGKNVYTHGQSRDNPIYNRSNLQQDELESTNIMICMMTEILRIVVLSGGVSCSKGCCRRFGRIFGKCQWFEIIDNILTSSSLKRCQWFQIIEMLNNRQISPNRNCSRLAIPWCFYKISRAFDGFSTSIIWDKDVRKTTPLNYNISPYSA